MNQKLVSVIIPTYNRASSVVEAIESVINQSYSTIQIIVVDDGSSDNTAEKVARFENVEYYFQQNKGQAAARNTGLSRARGEYIASLDSDDVWHKDFVREAVAAMERYETDFVFLNWTEVTEYNKTIKDAVRSEIWQKHSKNKDGEWSILNPAEVRKFFIQGFPAPSSSLVIRRSIFTSGWNEEMKIADDWYLILEMITNKPCRAAYTLKPYWTKSVHTSNIFDGRDEFELTKDLGLHDIPKIIQRFRKQFSFAENVFFKKILVQNYINFARLNYKRTGLSSEALSYLTASYKLAPIYSFIYTLQIFFLFFKSRSKNIQNNHKLFKA